MAEIVVQIRVQLDRQGLTWLRRALNAAESLDDLADWRPEVPRLAKCLRMAIKHLKPEVRK